MSNLLPDLAEFLGAVMKWWVILLTGPVISAFLLIYEWYSGQNINKLIVAVIAVSTILASFFLAWQEEKSKLLQSRNESEVIQQKLNIAHEELNSRKPRLNAELEQVVIAQRSDKPAVEVFILASVRNTGAPSIVDNWHVAITTENGTLADRPMQIPEELTIGYADGRPPLIFHRAEAIYEKTMRPIPQGSIERGWIRFHFDGVSMEQLEGKNAKFTLYFKDVLGYQYEASREGMTDLKSSPFYYHGTEHPYLPFDRKKGQHSER